jgi:type IV secretion system protein VirB8
MQNTIDNSLAKNKGEVSSSQKKGSGKQVDDYLKAVAEFETDRVDLAKKSAKTAWQVAAAFGVIALLAVIAVAALAPLKEVEPYVVRVSDKDGSVDILRPLSDAKEISYGELLDKYWARKFIITRNGYNWQTVQDDYNLIQLMSSSTVKSTYNTYIKSASSPVKVFVDKNRIEIKVQDVTFIPSKSNLAQVRFSRDVLDKSGVSDDSYEITYWNATITFDYQALINTKDERTLNPLAFRVTSYKEEQVIQQ